MAEALNPCSENFLGINVVCEDTESVELLDRLSNELINKKSD